VRARDNLMGITERAFAEDKKMIEAKAHNTTSLLVGRFMPATATEAVILFNRY